MKFFKFTQISQETGISWAIEQPLSGPTMPNDLLPGLNIIAEIEKPYFLGTANDEAQGNPDNHIFELSFEEFSTEMKNYIERDISILKEEVYQFEKDYRDLLFAKYHFTASLAGIYKYNEAKSYVNDQNSPAPNLIRESNIRGISPLELANKIITNHEEYIENEAKIAGIRGKLLDNLNNYVFNLNDPIGSHAEYYKTEKVGTIIRPFFNVNTQTTEPREEDVYLRKYTSDVGMRFRLWKD